MTSPTIARLRARPRPKARTVIVALVLLVLLFMIGNMAAAPEQSRRSAMEHFLDEMGVDVEYASTPTGTGNVALLPSDQRIGEELDLLLDWVRDGGRLIVTDPNSNLLRELGLAPATDAGLFGEDIMPTDCLLPETASVATVVAFRADRRLTVTGPAPQACFGPSGRAYLGRVEVGAGVVLVTGGDSFLSDQLLGKGGNAMLLMGMLGGRTHLQVLPSLPPSAGTITDGGTGATASSGGLWGTFPRWLQTMIWQITIAGLLFALARGRRFGMSPPEAPLVEIPASELVLATGALYQRARDARHAGAVTRRWWIRRMQRRFGIPNEGTVPVEQIASAAGDMSPRTIQALVEAPNPADDARLLELGKSLESITLTIEQGAKR